MTITVIGASIGAQFINGDYHTVSSRDAQDSRGAIEVAKHDLGQLD